jgi:hypothetical protein
LIHFDQGILVKHHSEPLSLSLSLSLSLTQTNADEEIKQTENQRVSSFIFPRNGRAMIIIVHVRMR